MAIVHRAELKPSKMDLLATWLPDRDWFAGVDDSVPIDRVSAFRFDDPAGEVGIETFIVGVGERRFHVPLTYRGAPLAQGALVGTLEHSVLGPRWVYDGPSDPVYVSVVREVIRSGGQDVDMVLDDGTPVPRLDWWGRAVGTGAPAEWSGDELGVARELPATMEPDAPALLGSWLGLAEPTVLAWLVDSQEAL